MPRTLRTCRDQLLQDILKTARKDAGLTQAGLAERIGRPQSFVAKIEGGERRLDVIEFIEVAEAVGTEPLHVLKRLLETK